MTTKFIHYRVVDDRANVASRGGITVAYVVGDEGATSAIAMCGPNDNYSRQYGRSKAAGRLLSAKYAKHHKGWRIQDVLDYYDDMALDAGLTRWARRP